MLAELYRLVEDREIVNDNCPHDDPEDLDAFCEVCFITNLAIHVSETEPSFTEETSERQRSKIEELHTKYCEDGWWDDESA